MHPRSTAARLWVDFEDRLIPLLRLTTHERALYYHLVRRTRLVGRRLLRISRRRMARASGLSAPTARHYLRVLARKQCIRFVDRGPGGSLVSVLLPDEILAKLGPGVPPPKDNSPLASLPHLLERDAAGQPRAWPRSDHFRNDEFRAHPQTRPPPLFLLPPATPSRRLDPRPCSPHRARRLRPRFQSGRLLCPLQLGQGPFLCAGLPPRPSRQRSDSPQTASLPPESSGLTSFKSEICDLRFLLWWPPTPYSPSPTPYSLPRAP